MSKDSQPQDTFEQGPESEESLAGDEDRETETATDVDSVAALNRALAEQNERYLRLAAEFDNFRRRTNKEKLESGTRAQAMLASTLLDSLDDLARVTALKPESPDASAFVEGVDLVARKLIKSLTNAGLEIINPVDEPFNPESQEAVATEPAKSAKLDDTVAAVFQPGYLFKGQLLRPAQVVVRKWTGH